MDRAQLALSSIGQYDTRATPLQTALVAAAVADGGSVRPPYLVERVTTANGRTVAGSGSHTPRRAMDPTTARRLRDLMRGVVENGTGANAALRHATVGGKTGTAQHGLGNSGTPFAWFVGWAQRDGRTLVFARVIEDEGRVEGVRAGLRARDMNSKPKILSREAYERMRLGADDWFIDAEIMIEARRLGLRIGEVPTGFLGLSGRRSFVSAGAVLEFLRNFALYRLRELRERGPRGAPGRDTGGAS